MYAWSIPVVRALYVRCDEVSTQQGFGGGVSYIISDLLRFPRCARSTPLPSLRCRQPFAARRTLHARVTPACVPLPTTPLFARCRALPRGRVRRPCRARAPCSAPFRARCACAPLQQGGARREGRLRGGSGAAHARERTAVPRRAVPPVHALACGCGLLTVSSRCSAALRRVLSRAPWSQHACTSVLTTLLVRSQRACGAERACRTAETSGACALLCADA